MQYCSKIYIETLNLNSKLYMSGDPNLPGTNWETSKREKGYNKEIYEDKLDKCNDAGLSRTVDEPTRENNVLDIFLTSSPLPCPVQHTSNRQPVLRRLDNFKYNCSMSMLSKEQ